MKYRIYTICKYGKFLGLIGFAGIFTHQPILSLFSFFWFLYIVEFIITFPTVLNAFKQLKGMYRLKKKHGDNIPDVENYNNQIAYSLPFEGQWVVINGGVTKKYSHSWEIVPQRYAYDFLILDELGHSYHGDMKDMQSYYCYNQKVLAPADGVVVEINEGEPNTLITGINKFCSFSKHIAGNYIIIKHSDNEYSTLAHLKKDSICVHVGDMVSRGQQIACCGNSGNSSEPHLHFQIQCSQDFFGSYSIPILFHSIDKAHCPKYEVADKREVQTEEELDRGRISRGYLVSNRVNIE